MRKAILALGSLLLFACSSTPSEDVGSDDDDITNIPQSGVKDQTDTGNCWLYATTAWAESLSANPTPHDYSTTYLVYWNFLDQITNAAKGFKGVEWTGGSWGQAAEIMQRYGLMELADFTGATTEDADAKLALSALTVVNKALKSGALRTKASRKDPVAVRKVLNQAFGLAPELVASLDSIFGADGQNTFDKNAQASGKVISPKTLRVRLPANGGSATLFDAIGVRAGDGSDADVRDGASAWRKADLEAEADAATRGPKLRTFLTRVQRALHDGVPVPISWCVEDPGKDEQQRFIKPISGVQDGDCAHETLIVDYEAKLPDGRVLAAGTVASPADEQAALSADTQIVFLRVKNSWGDGDDAPKRGYTDIYLDYVTSSIKSCPDKNAASKDCEDWSYMIDEVTLPPGY